MTKHLIYRIHILLPVEFHVLNMTKCQITYSEFFYNIVLFTLANFDYIANK